MAISGGPCRGYVWPVRPPQRMLPALTAGCMLALAWRAEAKVRNEGQWIGGVETTMR